MSERWYVVHPKPGQERAVDRGLAEIGVTGFYPTRLCRVSHAGKKVEVLRPLYPGYTFAMFDRDQDNWGKIIRLRGVDTILGVRRSSGKPATWGASQRFGVPTPMPKGVVEKLIQLAETSGGSIPTGGDPFRSLAKGEMVLVTDGPFTSFGGLVDEDHKTRVKVLLDILGRETPVWLPREAISLETNAA